MTGTVATLQTQMSPHMDLVGRNVGTLWDTWDNQRQDKKAEWLELRNYLFATDTSTTSNQVNPWKNSTTTPKLCQIRDNLHANYISALFPNDRWLVWEGYSDDDSTRDKVEAIQAYMSNKLIESGFRDIASSLVYDYIDYGIAFATVTYENDYYETDEGETVQGYVGPRVERISPLDIVFNPLASSFEKSPKIVRKVITVGEMSVLAQEDEDWDRAFRKTVALRNLQGEARHQDFNKAVAFQVDGFGSIYEYFGSQYVEVLTFYGDFYDPDEDAVIKNAKIVVIDRCITVSKGKIDNWLGKSVICCASWRKRPDNLYGMGPLDNLVGMQYRIDHLENLKADAMDLLVHPMLKIVGDVDEFEWQPGGAIYIPTGEGDVQELGQGLQGILSAQSEIQTLMDRMEEMAGAPKNAMGIRTPGEKTAFEVQALENAAGRIFQEKVINFETNLIEPLMNAMLAIGRQNLDALDIVRVLDDDLGVSTFIEITKEDITARGKLRPIGARHFAQQAQLIQNLNQLFLGGIGQIIGPHVSSKSLARVVEDALQLSRFGVIRPNVAVAEQVETQKLLAAAQEQAEVEASTPVPGEV